MTNSNDDFLLELQHDYLEEVLEHIANVEGCYLQLEKNTKDSTKLSEILRLFHNLKGSSAAVGFNHLSEFCHKVENLLSSLYKEEMVLNQSLVDLLLKCNDRVVESVHLLKADVTAPLEFSDLIQILSSILENSKKPLVTKKSEQVEPDLAIDYSLLNEYLTDINEHIETADRALINLEKNPTNKDCIHDIFRAFHTIKSSSAILNLIPIEHMAHELESLLEHVRHDASCFSGEISALCLDGSGLLKKLSEIIKRSTDPAALKDLFVQIEQLSQRAQILGIKTQKNAIEVQAQVSQSNEVATEVAPSKPILNINGKNNTLREPLRVDADRLDRLVDLIGELIIAEAMVTQSPAFRVLLSSSELSRDLDRLDKITRSLQEIGMSLRLVPVRQTFSKMNRIVRDIAKKLGKDVDLVLQGEDTEIDRTIAEKIGDPLVHMVRNAVDHGLEKKAEDRIQAGKSPTGRVELRAYHKAGSVWIDVEDDGKGLDRERLIKKALETGFLKPGQIVTDEEADQLIFMPGLSTADKVTDVSGRGVGMDVVKKNLQEIHGNVEIQTRKGKGTVFKIRIPNSLAIIEGMLIMVGRERYVIPAQSIVRAVSVSDSKVIRTPTGRGKMININGEILSLIYLKSFYNINEAKSTLDESIVLIVEDSNRRLAIVVDKILRKQQFVIKPLAEDMKNVPGIVGGTILPDGLVGLVIDVGLLLQDVSNDKISAVAG